MKASSLYPTNLFCSRRALLHDFFVLALPTALLLSHATSGLAQTYNLPGAGTWNDVNSWNPTTIPNAVGASVTFNNSATSSNVAQTATRAITADGSWTVGSIIFKNDAANAFANSITTGVTGSKITFDAAGSGPATITVPAAVGTGNNTISAPLTFNDDVHGTVDNVTASSAAGALNLTATISGAGGDRKST